jgi:hypothetical protein
LREDSEPAVTLDRMRALEQAAEAQVAELARMLAAYEEKA